MTVTITDVQELSTYCIRTFQIHKVHLSLYHINPVKSVNKYEVWHSCGVDYEDFRMQNLKLLHSGVGGPR